MKPNNNRSIVCDTKHLHSMLIRPQELASAFPLFSPRATDPSLLISLLSHLLLAKRATIGKQLPQLQPPKESMEQHSQPASHSESLCASNGSQLCRKSYVKGCKSLPESRKQSAAPPWARHQDKHFQLPRSKSK